MTRQTASKEKRISKIKFDELSTLYASLQSICSEYATMTDMYTLSTGNGTLSNIPQEVETMISERQLYFSLKQKVKDELKRRLTEDYIYE